MSDLAEHNWTIRQADRNDIHNLVTMFRQLFPTDPETLSQEEVESALADDASAPTFIAENGEGDPLGFLYLRQRNFADGCQSSPVAYVEAWWIREDYRRKGLGSALMTKAEEWARAEGLSEIASDADADNTESVEAHKALGFEILPAIIPFRKSL